MFPNPLREVVRSGARGWGALLHLPPFWSCMFPFVHAHTRMSVCAHFLHKQKRHLHCSFQHFAFLTNNISRRLAPVGAERLPHFLWLHSLWYAGRNLFNVSLWTEICVVFSFFTITSNTAINIILGPVVPYVFQDIYVIKP